MNGIATDFTMDLNAGLTQALSDGTYTYLYGVGRIAQYDVGGPQYFHGDALGSMRLLTDANGDVILSKSYQPYGAVLGSTGSGASSYGFTGEWVDGSTGQVYLRARWYAPSMGRFLTQDAWEGEYTQPMSYNAWLYAYANPINLVDPTGLSSSEPIHAMI